jgi:hypothetical protein
MNNWKLNRSQYRYPIGDHNTITPMIQIRIPTAPSRRGSPAPANAPL